MVPLISTSLERTSLPECSAINFLYSFGCDFDWSPWDRFESSPPELSDPSPIDEIVLCGMNFFNTHHHCNGYSHCQRVRWRKANFFIIYPQIGTTWPFYISIARRRKRRTRSTILNRRSEIENEIGHAWIRTREQGIMSPLLYP